MAIGVDDPVFIKVRDVLTQALAVDEEAVTPEARLNKDLGAESIDYLDITFQLEKSFGIKIPTGEMIPDSVFSNPEFVNQEGKVTPAGIAELKNRMPFADLTGFEQDPNINNFRDVLTVETICNYVKTKLPGGTPA